MAGRQVPGRAVVPDKAKALQRLAEARANLAGLERRAVPAVDPAIRAAVEQRQREIYELYQQVQSGKRGRAMRQARQQIEALEGTQRLVIECLGFRSYEEFQASTARADATGVDRRLIDAARQEVDRAERHFFDTAEMAIPVPTAAPLGGSPPAPPRSRPAPLPPLPQQHLRQQAPRWAAS